jgi:hypothetical protein
VSGYIECRIGTLPFSDRPLLVAYDAKSVFVIILPISKADVAIRPKDLQPPLGLLPNSGVSEVPEHQPR